MVDRKKILAISYLFPNSVYRNHGIFVLNRLKAMSQYSDITVINPIPDSPVHGVLSKFKPLKRVPKRDIIQGMIVYHPRFLSIPGYLKGLEIKGYKRAVQTVIDHIGFDFDLVDLHWTFPDLPTGDYLHKRYNVPFNVTLRGMEAFHFQDNDIRQKIVAKHLTKANRVIALSEEMAKTANTIAQTGPRTSVIRNGVDTHRFYYLDKHDCRMKLGLPLDKRIILGVGALIYRKGFDLVIKAIAELTKQTQFSDLVFYVIGAEGAEGDYRTKLKYYVDQHKLDAHVVFHGAVPNQHLVAWYNAADVFCLSSRGEGSPNVLTEALACGTPAVATRVGSVPEIMISEPELGETIESDNISELSLSLSHILTKSFDRQEAAKRFSKYTWDWCAKQVMEVI